jgi:hypothetical protein
MSFDVKKGLRTAYNLTVWGGGGVMAVACALDGGLEGAAIIGGLVTADRLLALRRSRNDKPHHPAPDPQP